MVDKHKFFSIVFNKVIPHIRRTLERIDEDLQISSGSSRCTLCGLKKNPGGICPECFTDCEKAIDEARDYRKGYF